MTDNGFNAERIRAMMAIRGFRTQSALAKAAGVHSSTLSRIISGRYNPTESEVRAIKAALSWPDEAQAETAFAILAGDGDEPLYD